MENKITVIMPVYNSENFLKEAIDSILQQTYKKFTFIIINDGSTDSSEKIIKEFDDPRIYYIKNSCNKGIVYSLNKGLSLASTKYIARMDSDDVCKKNRLQVQYEYMERHKDICLLGSSAYKIDKDGRKIGEICPTTDCASIKTLLLFSNLIIHPSVMIRRNALLEEVTSYDDLHLASEDYGMWCSIAASDKKIKILPDKLINYRCNDESITATTKKEKMLNGYIDIYSSFIQKLGINANREEILCYCSFVRGYNYNKNLKNFLQLEKRIRQALLLRSDYNIKLFDDVILGLIRGYAVENHIDIKKFFYFYKIFRGKIDLRFIKEVIWFLINTKKELKG